MIFLRHLLQRYRVARGIRTASRLYLADTAGKSNFGNERLFLTLIDLRVVWLSALSCGLYTVDCLIVCVYCSILNSEWVDDRRLMARKKLIFSKLWAQC